MTDGGVPLHVVSPRLANEQLWPCFQPHPAWKTTSYVKNSKNHKNLLKASLNDGSGRAIKVYDFLLSRYDVCFCLLIAFFFFIALQNKKSENVYIWIIFCIKGWNFESIVYTYTHTHSTEISLQEKSVWDRYFKKNMKWNKNWFPSFFRLQVLI